jgi:hypothetical protein
MKKTKCEDCGRRYSGYHSKAACLLYQNTRPSNKYGAKRATDGARSYMSQGERDCGTYLQWLEKGGHIRDLEFQVSIRLPEPGGLRYVIDFRFFDIKSDELVYADYKGHRTQRWNDCIKLWRLFGPAPLREYVGRGDAIELCRVIRPCV